MDDSNNPSICILGAGAYGIALALSLARGGRSVILWGRDKRRMEDLQESRSTKKYINAELDSKITCTSDLIFAVLQSKDIIIAVPTLSVMDLFEQIRPILTIEHRLAWAAKGLLPDGEGKFFHEEFASQLGEQSSLAIISGPSFAQEMSRGLPTAISIASNKKDFAQALAQSFDPKSVRVYCSEDLIGVQLGGVVKNILAVACGISDEKDLGASAIASVITRGLAEMRKLGLALGADPEVLMGLSGCGDAILSCTDEKSRNRRFGRMLAKGKSTEEGVESLGVVEAVNSVKNLCLLAEKNNIEMPISQKINELISGKISAQSAIDDLLARDLGSEKAY